MRESGNLSEPELLWGDIRFLSNGHYDATTFTPKPETSSPQS